MSAEPSSSLIKRRLPSVKSLITAAVVLLMAVVVIGKFLRVTDQGRKLAELEARGCEVILANPRWNVPSIEQHFPPDLMRMNCKDLVFFSNGVALTEDDLQRLAALPNLTGINLKGNSITDNSLAIVKQMKKLTGLVLTDTQVSDAGLAQLASLDKLDTLALQGPNITDACLSQVSGLTNLEWLHLDRSAVTDAGLIHLSALTKLREVHLQKSQVTPAGIAKLQTTMGAVKIEGP